MEPTPGPGVCLEELGFDREEAAVAHGLLYEQEHDYVEVIVRREEGLEVGLILFVGLDCLEVVGVRVRGCGGARERVFGMTGWPEVSRVDLEAGCAEAFVPADPPYRVRAALEKLGAWPPRPVDARVLDPHDVEEWFEVQGQGLA